MLDPNKTLLLDVGNTSIKYSFFYIGETEKNITVNYIDYSDLSQVVEDPLFVFICSVRDSAFNLRLGNQLSKLGCEFEFIQSQSQFQGLTNSYKTVSNMGADRWVGMIGAKALVGDSFLLVDAGTAITIDAVKLGQHLGGWIVAGKQTAQNALLSNTKRVFSEDNTQTEISFGQDTPECVEHGSNAMATGVVLMALKLLEKNSVAITVVISGGDSALISNSLKKMSSTHIVKTKNIVLIGLATIANITFLC